MKFQLNKKYLYWGLTAFLVIASSIGLCFLMFRGTNIKDGLKAIISITMPIIDGLILAYLLTPVLNFIESRILLLLKKDRSSLTKKRFKYLRMSSILLTLIFVGCAVYAFFSMVIPQLFQSIESIAAQFPSYVDNLTRWLEEVLSDNPEVEAYLSDLINTYTPNVRDWINSFLLPQMNEVFKVVSLYAINLFKATWNLIIGLIISVYIMASKETFIGQAKKSIYATLDTKRGNYFIQDIRFIHKTFGGFINGKILDSIIIGILCFIGLTIMKTPYPVLISVIIGVTNVIPFFGPYFGAVPSALLILMINPMQCLYFLIFILVLQQFDGNILGPKILGNSTGLTSFWVIFSITFFGGFMGVPGMIIGVPLFAVIYAMVRRHINFSLKNKKLSTDTADYKYLKTIHTENQLFEEFNPEEYECMKAGTFARKKEATEEKGDTEKTRPAKETNGNKDKRSNQPEEHK